MEGALSPSENVSSCGHHDPLQRKKHNDDRSSVTASSQSENFEQIIENYQWIILLISIAEEEVRVNSRIIQESKRDVYDADADDRYFSKFVEATLQALTSLYELLSASFAPTISHNVDQRFSDEYEKYTRVKQAETTVIYSLSMIRPFLVSLREAEANRVSYPDEYVLGTIALETLSLLLEKILEDEWVREDDIHEAYIRKMEDKWASRADAAVSFFASVTDTVEAGLAEAVPVMNKGLDYAGELVKDSIKPIPEERRPVVPKTISESSQLAKVASAKAHKLSKQALVGIGGVATSAVNNAANRIDETTTQRNSLYKRNRGMMNATGRVAVAGVGAFASISESLFDTSLKCEFCKIFRSIGSCIIAERGYHIFRSLALD